MPQRAKRNAASRRNVSLPHHSSFPDLLAIETNPYAPSPAIVELEPPPSDPELGRSSIVIRDTLDASPPVYAHQLYAQSESDIDDGGPISPSTSPPDLQHTAPQSRPPFGSARLGLSDPTILEDTPSEDSSSLGRSVGHIRSPVLARTSRSHCANDREPTPLESFSRTIRNYVPSSIPIPSAAPSPPRVSRPVSFGSFLTPSPTIRRTSESDPAWRGQQRRSVSGAGDMAVFSLDDDVPEDGPREDEKRVTRYPGVGDSEKVLWAGWDVLADVSPSAGHETGGHASPSTVLMLGYPSGLQVWDCSNLGSVSELLNLAGPQWGSVEFAALLPHPSHTADDAFYQKRPLIGFSSRNAQGTDFLVYSLRTHEVVKRLSLIGVVSFAASNRCFVLCTANPPYLHVYSSATLAPLYTIPSSSLVSFTFPLVSTTSSPKLNINDVTPLDIDEHYAHKASLPRPIYAISNRLLAYVSPITRHDPTAAPTSGEAHTSVPVAVSDNIPLKFGLGMSQAELSNAAVKLGGSVLSGMKAFGGMAISAARAGVSAAVSGEQGHARGRSVSNSGPTPGGGAAVGMFFSKSAPAVTSSPHEYQTAADRRRHSVRISSLVHDAPVPFDSHTTVTQGLGLPQPVSPVAASSGGNVTVVDMQALLMSDGAAQGEPEIVAQFTFSQPQALSGLKFSADGTSLAVCSKDGHAVRVFQLRPTPHIARRPSPFLASTADKNRVGGIQRTPSSSGATENLAESAQHVYTLHRGRTSAVIESMEWAPDKLWFGIGTRKRTIHVFAVNPLGGRSEGGSHLAGKVVNSPDSISSTTELSPLVRVRLKPLPHDSQNIPCAFTFLRSEAILPPSLLPPASVHFSPSASSSPPSNPSGGLTKPVSPAQLPTRPTNYKHLLVFDPNDGMLALHRIFVERAPIDHAVIPESVPVAGGMSISLPGMRSLTRMGQGASPPNSSVNPRAASGLTQMMEKPTEITGRESVVGTWSLVRGRNWPEVRQSLRLARSDQGRVGRAVKSDWLSRAELSTFSSSPRVLPRLIYLSHQFSFHTLGEDYHALIRSYHLDLPSVKIEVRKPIEVSAFVTGDSDPFVQGMPSHHAIGRPPSSFDEPLASALSAQLHPMNPSPPVLPMLPNGTPGSGSGSKSLKLGIPVRQVAAGIHDGMSEGFGRIRRELGKARSPRLQATRPGLDPHSSSVPLEFDEEDEDFLVKDVVPAPLSADREMEADVVSRSALTDMHAGSGLGTVENVPTPLTGLEPLPADHDGDQMWEGWGPEDQQAVEEAERFDDITVGFMDEEHEMMRETEVKKSMGKKQRGRRG